MFNKRLKKGAHAQVSGALPAEAGLRALIENAWQAVRFFVQQKQTPIFVLLGVCALSLASQVAIPLKPVPLTFQTFVALCIGLTFTPNRALLTGLSFLSLTALGFPLCAGYMGGITHLLGPTGGYILGFALVPFVIASVRHTFNLSGLFSFVGLGTLGSVFVLFLGMLWVSLFVGFSQAFHVGFKLFLFLEGLKVLFAAYTCRLFLVKGGTPRPDR